MTLKYIMFDRGSPCLRGLRGEHDCGEADAAREDFSHYFVMPPAHEHDHTCDPGTRSTHCGLGIKYPDKR